MNLCASPRSTNLQRWATSTALRELRTPLAAFCCGRGIKGTLLLAQEGINGTVAGSETDIADLIAHLESVDGIAGLEVKYSTPLRCRSIA